MALFGRGHDDASEGTIRALIAADAERVLTGATLDPASGDLLVPVSGGRARVATGEIVQHAVAQPEASRAEVVRRWLVDIAAQVGVSASATPSSTPASGALRLQVMPGWQPEALATVASSPVPMVFDAIVTFFDGARLQYLLSAQADGFGGEIEAARIAIGQTITEELLDVDVRDHDAGGFLMRLIAKDDCPFVTTALMSLPRFLPIPVADALVIAPRYSAIALVPLTAQGEIGRAASLAGLASTMHANAVDPCTTDVFWWHDGTFYALTIDDDGTIALPPELAAAATALP